MTWRWYREAGYLCVWAGIEAGQAAVRVLPRSWAYGLSDTIAGAAFYLCPAFRRRSLENLQAALGHTLAPGEAERVVRASLRNFFRAFVEVAAGLTAPPSELRSAIPAEGFEHLEAALAKGNGVIAISVHLGNFFLAGARMAAEGYPTHVLVNPPKNARLASLMDGYRAKILQHTIHSRPRQQALRELVEVLRKNEVALVIADEYRRGAGVLVPFFERTVLARRGPATLALRTGAALVPLYVMRTPDGALRLVIEPELEISRGGKSRMAVREAVLRITGWVERTVRRHPDQWNWMTVHWHSAPQRVRGTNGDSCSVYR
ncbi:MAG TPA: hypothetical protein VNN77_18835 [candidate division Zixibacteria bacterium]|nr:hypothetical protein [candidate division Zixibacteria bacterium]